MDWLSALLLGVLGSFLASGIWEQFKSGSSEYNLDQKSLALLESALKMLPEADREIYKEEWFMFLCDQPNARKRFLNALTFLRAAVTINVETNVVVPVTQIIAKSVQSIGSSKLTKSRSTTDRAEFWANLLSRLVAEMANIVSQLEVFIIIDDGSRFRKLFWWIGFGIAWGVISLTFVSVMYPHVLNRLFPII